MFEVFVMDQEQLLQLERAAMDLMVSCCECVNVDSCVLVCGTQYTHTHTVSASFSY